MAERFDQFLVCDFGTGEFDLCKKNASKAVLFFTTDRSKIKDSELTNGFVDKVVKNLAEREKVRDSVKSKLDDIINSGATRSQLERGLMALIADESGKGNAEAVRLIEQTLGSLKDKLG